MANAKKKQRREFKLPPLMSQLQALAFMLFQNINFIFSWPFWGSSTLPTRIMR